MITWCNVNKAPGTIDLHVNVKSRLIEPAIPHNLKANLPNWGAWPFIGLIFDKIIWVIICWVTWDHPAVYIQGRPLQLNYTEPELMEWSDKLIIRVHASLSTIGALARGAEVGRQGEHCRGINNALGETRGTPSRQPYCSIRLAIHTSCSWIPYETNVKLVSLSRCLLSSSSSTEKVGFLI